MLSVDLVPCTEIFQRLNSLLQACSFLPHHQIMLIPLCSLSWSLEGHTPPFIGICNLTDFDQSLSSLLKQRSVFAKRFHSLPVYDQKSGGAPSILLASRSRSITVPKTSLALHLKLIFQSRRPRYLSGPVSRHEIKPPIMTEPGC